MRRFAAVPQQQPEPYNGIDVRSPAVQFSKNYLFQSYYDSALLENALLSQPQGEGIVQIGSEEVQLKCWAAAVHPDSQTPLAVQFRSSESGGGSCVFLVRPGEVIHPAGGGPFEGLRFGMPFGWLGGGTATLIIFLTPQSDVTWTAQHEVIFHRVRVPILQPAEVLLATNARKNWPMRFPWSQAFRGTNLVDQSGQAVIGIMEPTRVGLVLRGSTGLANPADMRIVYQATNDFGVDSAGAPVLTDPVFDTITWGSFAALGAAGNLATPDPIQLLTGDIARLAADDGGVAMIDASGSGALAGCFVDVCRYGKI